MNNKKIIEECLEKQPLFRERSRKDKGIITILASIYPELKSAIDSGLLRKNTLISIVQDYSSLDRSWRRALQENPKWRGTDYGEKWKLAKKKMLDLGYKV
jgi:hypothetical protein